MDSKSTVQKFLPRQDLFLLRDLNKPLISAHNLHCKCYQILRKCYSSTFICQSRSNSFYFTLSFLHYRSSGCIWRQSWRSPLYLPWLNIITSTQCPAVTTQCPTTPSAYIYHSATTHPGDIGPLAHAETPTRSLLSRCRSWTRLLLTAPPSGKRHPSHPSAPSTGCLH